MKVLITEELVRKLIHLSTIIIPISYRYLFDYNREVALFYVVPLLFFAVIIELIRLKNKRANKLFIRFFGVYIRKQEECGLTGATYLLISCIASIILLQASLAFNVMCFLIIGDALASLVGRHFGKRFWKNSEKSLEGSLAFFIGTFLFALIDLKLLPLALIGSLLATIAELSAFPINDNLKIPLLSGAGMFFYGLLI